MYDEFGSILLLILAFKYKYDLTPSDLGIDNPDSFVLRLLAKGDASQKLEDLTEKQSQNLGAWISALFIAEGISDESMSSCSPQEFYLLVATLFSQSLGACESGKLEFETLKGGFECKSFLDQDTDFTVANVFWKSRSFGTIPSACPRDGPHMAGKPYLGVRKRLDNVFKSPPSAGQA